MEIQELYSMVSENFDWLNIALMALMAGIIVLVVFELTQSSALKSLKEEIMKLEDRLYGSRLKKKDE